MKELRTIQRANPDKVLEVVAVAVPPEDLEDVEAIIQMVTDAANHRHEGELYALVLRVHDDPHARRAQYHDVLQHLHGALGPREGESFSHFFDATLELN